MEMCSPNISHLAAAMVRARAKMKPAPRDAVNSFTKSRYSTLNSIMDSCLSALLEQNIWITQFCIESDNPNILRLCTKLTHAETGEYQIGILNTPLPKADPQGTGIALTYLRRYALSAMLGLVTEDFDGDAEYFRTSQKDSPTDISSLPTIEGVVFKTITEGNCKKIIATGNTMPCKDELSRHGFKWDYQNKVWYRAA